jgi:hypothetical protein
MSVKIIGLTDIKNLNKKVSKTLIDKRNEGGQFTLFLGEFIRAFDNFRGVVIGDNIKPVEDGFYVGSNMVLTEDGLKRPLGVIIYGGDDEIALELRRTNKISVIDGTNDNEPFIKSDIMPIDDRWNWGRPIIDGGNDLS